MTPNSDTNTAIELLETLLKAKIRLQDAQAEAEPMLETVGLLFEPEALNDDQKNLLRNGLKSLRKLLEAHTAYGEAVQQAEPAREIVNQLLGSQPPKQNASNGKADPQAVEEKPEEKLEQEPEEKLEEKLEQEPEEKLEENSGKQPEEKSKAPVKGSGNTSAKTAK